MMYMDDVPFDVLDQEDVQDLTDVKKEQNLFPASKDLKVRIAKAAVQTNDDKDIKSLNLELRVVDGIANNEGVMERVNAPIFTGFMDLVFKADTTVKGRADNRWWKNNQHLVGFKEFVSALGLPLSGLKVNDQFLSDLLGREVLVSIVHEAEKVKDESGKKVATGEFNQRLKLWKKAA